MTFQDLWRRTYNEMSKMWGNYFDRNQKRKKGMYSARNLEMSIRFSLKYLPSERFHRSKMSQIKAEISLRTNVQLNFHKNVGFPIPDFL